MGFTDISENKFSFESETVIGALVSTITVATLLKSLFRFQHRKKNTTNNVFYFATTSQKIFKGIEKRLL